MKPGVARMRVSGREYLAEKRLEKVLTSKISMIYLYLQVGKTGIVQLVKKLKGDKKIGS